MHEVLWTHGRDLLGDPPVQTPEMRRYMHVLEGILGRSSGSEDLLQAMLSHNAAKKDGASEWKAIRESTRCLSPNTEGNLPCSGGLA